MNFISIFSTQKKYQIFIYVFILFFNISTNINAQDNNKYELSTIVLDAGHGGIDNGTSGKYSKEKDIALKLALKVGNYIESNFPDVKVIYTRKTDVFVPLDKRAEIANSNKADLFISIHLNGVTNHKVYGTETFVMGLHKSNENLEVAKKENSAILFEKDYSTKYEGFEPNSSESYIIFSLLQNTFQEQSLSYASIIQDQFTNRTHRKNRGVKQAGFWVLWKTTMPSVLIEAGFLSNPKEEKYLISEKGQDYIASAIYRSFKDYKNSIEAKSNFSTKVIHDNNIVQNELPYEKILDTNKVNNTQSNNVLFKVQIASSRNPIPLNSKFFNGLNNIKEYKSNNIYKYTVGSKNEYKQILHLKDSIINIFPDAFIIALQKDTIIPLKKALSIINN